MVMTHNGNQPTARAITLVVLLAVALCMVACGSDNDDDASEGGGGNPAAQSQAGGEDTQRSEGGSTAGGAQSADTTGQEDQVHAAYTKYIQTFYSRNPENICNLISQEAQQAWARPPATSCQQGVKALFASGATLSPLKPKIANITIKGNKATVSTTKAGKRTGPGPLIKENGQWKVDAGGGP
jgi:hypothetical protein